MEYQFFLNQTLWSLATRRSNSLRLSVWTSFEKLDTVRRRNSVIIMWRDICWLQLPNFDIVTAKRWRQRRTFYAFHNFQRGCEQSIFTGGPWLYKLHYCHLSSEKLHKVQYVKVSKSRKKIVGCNFSQK